MALRSRVPRRKSLGSGNRKRNKNPKLSPYQREQKRDRLANQAPVNLQKRDFPAHARELVAYMTARKERDAARAEKAKENKARREAEAGAEKLAAEKVVVAAAAENAQQQVKAKESAAPEKKVKKGKGLKIANAVPLVTAPNETNKSESQLHNEKVLRLKEKSALKKAERRKKRAIEKMDDLAEEMTEIMRASKKGKAGAESAAEKLELRRMQKELKQMDKEGHVKKDADSSGGTGDSEMDAAIKDLLNSNKKKKKEANDEATAAAKAAMKRAKRNREAADGEEKVDEDGNLVESKKSLKKLTVDEKIDRIQFGERVDAPPVFDVAPSASKSSLLPVHRMGNQKKLELSERKRLEKLGLLPTMESSSASEAQQGDDGAAPFMRPVGSSSISRPTTAAGFEAYRQEVMERYKQKRTPSAVFHPGEFFNNQQQAQAGGSVGNKRRDR